MMNGAQETNQTRGLYFEDFQVGWKILSPGRTVTESDIVLFAGLSGDYNQLHTDAEFAKATPFGQRVAHGLLGLIMATGLASRLGFIEGTAQAFLGVDWRFKAPIFIGDTISLKAEVTKKKAMHSLGGGIVVWDVTLHNQRGEKVQEGEWRALIKGKGG